MKTTTIMGNDDDRVGFERDEWGCACTNPMDKVLGDRFAMNIDTGGAVAASQA